MTWIFSLDNGLSVKTETGTTKFKLKGGAKAFGCNQVQQGQARGYLIPSPDLRKIELFHGDVLSFEISNVIRKVFYVMSKTSSLVLSSEADY